MCECNVRCDPVRVQGLTAAVLEAGCQLLLIAGCRETVQLDFWDAAGPHDSELQKLMDFMEGSAWTDVLSALIPVAFRGRSQRCWRRDADFSSSQSAERRFG